MAWSRPTLREIITRVLDDIETELAGVNARLSRSTEKAVGIGTSGASHQLHGHISALERMLNWLTASGNYLFGVASLFGITRLQPSQSQITYRFTGTPTTTIPAGTVVTIGGVDFETDAEDDIEGGGSVDIAMTSVDVGTTGNVDDGTSGTLETPITGVDSAGTVQSLDIEARDLEEEEDTRARWHARLRRPPTGGGPGDYATWVEETPTVAVAKAWEYPLFLGGGTVGVIFAKASNRDNDSDGENGDSVIPTSGEVATVLAYLATKAPTTAYKHVYAPIAQPINPIIRVPVGTTTEVQDAIRASLHDLLDPDNGQKPGGIPNATEVTVLLTHFSEAISQAEGEVDHELVSPAANISSAFGYLPILGVVDFQETL